MTRRIVIVGGGTFGMNLGVRLREVGHVVNFAGRNPQSEKVLAALAAVEGSRCSVLAEAADDADVLILAVPYSAVVETLDAIGDVGDAVLVDATNAIGTDLGPGHASVLDVIAEVLPNATLVKAFNTIGAETAHRPVIDGTGIFLPIAGDLEAAEVIRGLAEQMGFDARVIGGRKRAHFLEEFAALCIHLAVRGGLGADFGFAVLKR